MEASCIQQKGTAAFLQRVPLKSQNFTRPENFGTITDFSLICTIKVHFSHYIGGVGMQAKSNGANKTVPVGFKIVYTGSKMTANAQDSLIF